MEVGHFYYIDDQYFKDFPDPYLMQNKEKVNGQLHDRPCFYAFQDSNTQLFWMIPFSSLKSCYAQFCFYFDSSLRTSIASFAITYPT